MSEFWNFRKLFLALLLIASSAVAQPTGPPVGPANCATSPTLACLAGRTTTTNDFTISTSGTQGGSILGSSVANAPLKLNSGTATAAGGVYFGSAVTQHTSPDDSFLSDLAIQATRTIVDNGPVAPIGFVHYNLGIGISPKDATSQTTTVQDGSEYHTRSLVDFRTFLQSGVGESCTTPAAGESTFDEYGFASAEPIFSIPTGSCMSMRILDAYRDIISFSKTGTGNLSYLTNYRSFRAGPTFATDVLGSNASIPYTAFYAAPIIQSQSTGSINVRGLNIVQDADAASWIGVDMNLTNYASANRAINSSGNAPSVHAGTLRLGDTTVATQQLEVKGNVKIDNNGATPGELRLDEPSGDNYRGLKVGAATADKVFVLPDTGTSGNDVVVTDSTATLTNKTIDGGVSTTTHAAGANFLSLMRHATDCTAITDGAAGEACYEIDADTLYVCEPSAGGCDTAGEWKATGGAGATDHGALTGLGDDDHAQYLLLAGRTTTTNDFLISTSGAGGGSIRGSSVADAPLNLSAGHATDPGTVVVGANVTDLTDADLTYLFSVDTGSLTISGAQALVDVSINDLANTHTTTLDDHGGWYRYGYVDARTIHQPTGIGGEGNGDAVIASPDVVETTNFMSYVDVKSASGSAFNWVNWHVFWDSNHFADNSGDINHFDRYASFFSAPSFTAVTNWSGGLYYGLLVAPVGDAGDQGTGMSATNSGWGTTLPFTGLELAIGSTPSTNRSISSTGAAPSTITGTVRIGDTTVAVQPLEVLGNIRLDANGATAPELRLDEPSGTDYTGFKTAARTGNLIYTLPTDTPADGDVLTYHTGDLLSWDAPGAGSGDVTAVGPSCATGACFTDGLATTGSSLLVWEGVTADTAEFTLAFADDDPSADVTWTIPDAATSLTFPSGTRTLATLDGSETLTNKTISIGGTTSEATGFLNFTAVGAGSCGSGEYWVQASSGTSKLSFCDNGTLRTLGGVVHSVSWFLPGTPTTGLQIQRNIIPAGLTNCVLTNTTVVSGTTSGSASTYNVDRCTANCTSTTAATWSEIYSSDFTLAANDQHVDGGTPNTTTVSAGDQFRVSQDTGAHADVTATLTFTCDN